MANSSSSLMAIVSFLVVVLALSQLADVAISKRHVPGDNGGGKGGGGNCKASGQLRGKSHKCNKENGSDCCKSGESYPQFRCSPPISGQTRATLTLNSFAKGGDGGGQSECDNKYHSDKELVVALSTGWYNGGKLCGKSVRISVGGKTVTAKVVDECDSSEGCDEDHDFQPPCKNNIVDASPAVWKALGISGGEHPVTWSLA